MTSVSLIDRSDMVDVLDAYRRTRADTDIDVAGYDWNDVIKQMRIACSDYNEKGKSSKIRGFFRKHASNVSAVLSPVLDLIPDDYGLQSLKGGLALLFNVR